MARGKPAELVKRNWHFMLIGLLLGGVLGYFAAGTEGRALGGGIGAALVLAAGGLIWYGATFES